MVIFILKYDVDPDKMDAFNAWAPEVTQRAAALPGYVEFQSFVANIAPYRVMTVLKFADLPSWAAWKASDEVQTIERELRTLALNVAMELWDHSPVTPEPLYPAK